MSRVDKFRHEAALYVGIDGFLEATLPYIREGLGAGEPVMVAVPEDKIARLRTALGADAAAVRFVDMARLGANPARIIPAWSEFVRDRPTERARLWGIGEPIGPQQQDAVLVECQLHESLLNLAFAETEDFNLLCPYDTDALDGTVIAEACRSHPLIRSDGIRQPASANGEPAMTFTVPLSPAPRRARTLQFDSLESISEIRCYVDRQGRTAGIEPGRLADLVLAVNELVANSFVHGDGRGVLRSWEETGSVIFEVADGGRFNEPLAGRRLPLSDGAGGWGLWMANQVCELVQVRSLANGCVVRLHMSRHPRSAIS